MKTGKQTSADNKALKRGAAKATAHRALDSTINVA